MGLLSGQRVEHAVIGQKTESEVRSGARGGGTLGRHARPPLLVHAPELVNVPVDRVEVDHDV
jgi:hypothetical protein